MDRNEDNNYIVVRNLAELKLSKWWMEWYVFAICPKCKEGWTSRPENAKRILTNNCLGCSSGTDDDWTPTLEILTNKKP